ncbi:hypothetical protein [Paractinoplanes lichenicola]|uniref:Uncharacterized protein n=1 Tax=Paractinoplanes lichenicola TaxID=2802976 RepID=A0ABS1W3Q5_9ACTN|nr:hypothetical protein [Actinoplanes lichenicola]MBL7261352.1 hypothetical protein [Actinoplanes lichenicola]
MNPSSSTALDLPPQFFDFVKILRDLFDGETAPLTFAFVAILISVWAAVISRRSMRASERSAFAAELQAGHAARQAESAEQQAVAARDEANSASTEAGIASHSTEISALETARARIDAAMPRVAVVMHSQVDHAGLAENSYRIPLPTESLPNLKKVRLEHWPQWAWDAFFVSHGFLYNFGNEPVRVIADGLQFYAGKHPFTGDEVPNLPRTLDGSHFLMAGDYALFQVIARKQVDDWVEILKKQDGVAESCESFVWFYPANFDKPECGAKIRTDGMPLSRIRRDNVYAIFQSESYFSVHVEYIRKYPDSTEIISAELRNDRDELFRIATRKAIHESLANNSGLPMREESSDDVDDLR